MPFCLCLILFFTLSSPALLSLSLFFSSSLSFLLFLFFSFFLLLLFFFSYSSSTLFLFTVYILFSSYLLPLSNLPLNPIPFSIPLTFLLFSLLSHLSALPFFLFFDYPH